MTQNWVQKAQSSRLLSVSPTLLMVVWSSAIGLAVWHYAAAEVEPPGFDVLSYFAKAFYFWEAVDHGKIFNPFSLAPTVRPPGTVLVSYPLGLTDSFQGYYFRSIFLPILLLLAAAWIGGHSAATKPRRPPWLLGAVALALAGMPALYQFQANQALPAVGYWGLVDNFLAGMAGIAIASTTRSVRMLSATWTLVGALAAVLCFAIKPTGLVIMGLVTMTWLILIAFRIGRKPLRLVRDPKLRRYVLVGSAGGILIYTLGMAFSSPYFSHDNIAFGSSAMHVLRKDFATSIDLRTLHQFLSLSFGYVILAGLAVGLAAAMITRGERSTALSAGLCLGIGGWFWIVGADVAQIRYFLPFGVMAFLIIEPSLLLLLEKCPASIRIVFAVTMISPTIAVTVLLNISQPSQQAQKWLGVNLTSAAYRHEVEESNAFLSGLAARGKAHASVYLLDLSAPVRNFASVIAYRPFIDNSLPRIDTLLSIDWSHPSAFRLSDLSKADYVVFEPIRAADERQAYLNLVTVESYVIEMQLMRAWFSQLPPEDGTSVAADVGFRLLKITDHKRFDRALQRLRVSYRWREEFLQVNPRNES